MDLATRGLDPVELWPGGAPGAMGDGSADRPRITPFLPQADEPTGAVVVCPGGGYHVLAAHEKEPIARWAASLGMAGILLEYRVAPYRHPIPLGDAQRALRLVRARAGDWNIDPRRVAILGFSAGGHLAGCAATMFDAGRPEAADPVERQSCRPDALIACYAVVSLDRYHRHNCMENLLGAGPDEELIRRLSLENRVTADTPPTFIWHTADDEMVPLGNALLMAEVLRRHEVPVALHVFPHGRHGLGLAEDDPTVGAWKTLCAQWLADLEFRRGPHVS
ncbi:MAG TPA: alpha/beta hydrolase [Phycisphaerae bacterium]|nr:alpha/beta hydrolase [Phycisphaerae bacterium]